MIAKPLAMALGFRYALKELMRHAEMRSQVGLARVENRKKVQDAIQAGKGMVGKKVLVMDDVSTMGSTLSSSADALCPAGAGDVYALTVARAMSHYDLGRV